MLQMKLSHNNYAGIKTRDVTPTQHDHRMGQSRGSVPVKFLSPVFTRNSHSENTPFDTQNWNINQRPKKFYAHYKPYLTPAEKLTTGKKRPSVLKFSNMPWTGWPLILKEILATLRSKQQLTTSSGFKRCWLVELTGWAMQPEDRLWKNEMKWKITFEFAWGQLHQMLWGHYMKSHLIKDEDHQNHMSRDHHRLHCLPTPPRQLCRGHSNRYYPSPPEGEWHLMWQMAVHDPQLLRSTTSCIEQSHHWHPGRYLDACCWKWKKWSIITINKIYIIAFETANDNKNIIIIIAGFWHIFSISCPIL